ncbi:MAG: hypothetical protein WAK18_08415 [Nocardioidaceae bacterium]
MFLGSYHFDGNPTTLIAAYERLNATFPAGQHDVRICVVRDGGITVYDTCPSREVFAGFSTGSDFSAVLASIGLPPPRVEPIGDIHAALVGPAS